MTDIHDEHHVEPRLRPDGSIDTAYYLQRSRILRSEQAHAMLKPRRAPEPRRSAGWMFGFGRRSA